MDTKTSYIGLGLLSLATLMYEITLTRIFSVTMWYHLAFMAISIVLFGMTVGAIFVYLAPNTFAREKVNYFLALSSLLFTITTIVSFVIHLNIPLNPNLTSETFPLLAVNYALISIPFMFSGICVSLALTKFPQYVGKLYAADLIGAAIGCLLIVYLLKFVSGPTAVLFASLISGISSIFFTKKISKNNRLQQLSILSCILLLSMILTQIFNNENSLDILRLKWVKGFNEPPPLHEKWNAFSRISVWGDPEEPTKAFGWGLSPRYSKEKKHKQLILRIDASAETPLTYFDGNIEDLNFLKYDIVNLVHYAKKNAKVLVVGAGGGRDVLSALVFDQKSITAVEINEDIIRTVNQTFGEFTGHLDQNSKVTFVSDEARSYIARQKDKFDIIQVSLIDTWAATSAGAFMLSENTLYTTEAWQNFLEHLSSDGVLSFSRWYFKDLPGEMYRLTSLASTSLQQIGVENPQQHIFIAKHMLDHEGKDSPDGIGTLLVSKTPFSSEDVKKLGGIVQELQFETVVSPQFTLDETFATIVSGKNIDGFIQNFPLNIKAPTDDNPFFFQMLRLRDIINTSIMNQGSGSLHTNAVFILGSLFIIIFIFTILSIFIPLILTRKTRLAIQRDSLPIILFFTSIGVGFMLIEISQLQRFTIFLGHPTYSLSVVLFTLLLSSGFGSYTTQNIKESNLKIRAVNRFISLILIVGLIGVITPFITEIFQASISSHRIIISALLLFPMGFFMGMAFPLGMKLASKNNPLITPWLWGINGATTVYASVLAAILALIVGISTTFWIGVMCYVLATISFIQSKQ